MRVAIFNRGLRHATAGVVGTAIIRDALEELGTKEVDEPLEASEAGEDASRRTVSCPRAQSGRTRFGAKSIENVGGKVVSLSPPVPSHLLIAPSSYKALD